MTATQSIEEMLRQAMVLETADYRTWLLVLPVIICFLFGAGLLMLRRQMHWHAPVAVVGLVLLLAADIALFAEVWRNGTLAMAMGGWKPPYGISFVADMTSVLFLTVAGFVGLACGIYAIASIDQEERRYGFYPFLFMLMAGVSGAFLTGDIFNLYVWFEVMLIGSFGLLILGSEREQLDGATKYCFLNLIGATVFLLTTGYIYGTFGTLNMADIAVKAAAVEGDGTLLTIAALFLVAFSMKAAAFPLNFWLPASYHTPRFVVSALFAGLLTKVGVYGLIRVELMLFPPERGGLGMVMAWMAALTMMTGALGALAQSDMRRMLNYVVITGIGTILAGMAIPPFLESASDSITTGAASVLSNRGLEGNGAELTTLATGLAGALFYAIHSIVVMTALYLAAGVAAFRNGSSSLHEMGGLWRRNPIFSVMFLVLLLAVAGLPPFSGFWPKMLLVRASVSADLPWLAAVILLSGLLITIACIRAFALAFWRPLPALAAAADVGEARQIAEETFRAPPPGTPVALVPLVALCIFVIATGLWPEWLAKFSYQAAAELLQPRGYLSSILEVSAP
ncbi:Na+/H+ antiporter subunit D [Aureimonas fodinaquatilis]|uniref:Na+/H+ antiporter subunit D n=1 Tax=Aureimonas fodinaquatilis TaxID=2565783 RepID=A0A5B0E0W6_9HYPH|nr:proton-conducting transporter membrane subunit [Aureimonas fodinaquatilis]KAA0972306.1 Na+/H+ antiporter subunit D [Aureimonas fodinaquatilis]